MSAKRKASIPKPANGPVAFVTHQEKFSPTEADAPDDDHFAARNGDLRLSLSSVSSADHSPGSAAVAEDPAVAATAALWNYHAALTNAKKTPPGVRDQMSPVTVDRASIGHDSSSVHDETSSSGNKDDDDDDDEEADERLDAHKYDPERLKAFNMFVRLFVDENLDRIVPISKQPKEKIQAIIDSCTRQFPEFAERARKRIRTYLKSCRRNKRTRDSNGTWDTARPTPAHLTSVQAEQILASACENESHNAKRMRLGLEPVSQPMPVLAGAVPVDTIARTTMHEHFTTTQATSTTPVAVTTGGASAGLPVSHNQGVNMTTSPAFNITPSSERESKIQHSINSITNNNNHMVNNNNTTAFPYNNSIKKEPSLEIIPTQMKSCPTVNNTSTVHSTHTNNSSTTITPVNGTSPQTTTSSTPPTLYRPNFSQAFQRTNDTVSPVSSGPTDLSMKTTTTKPLLSHKLSSTEMIAVRQLITGYRESAAFLLRSADELEQLLINQP
ncbi:nucleolar protein 4-like [Thrips palmi]|uniref:Nucleolar protein 4-like n=1 Tax=Thrips palmi TaxID=161013 RepID=A0A6P8ZNE1_THRPL|nr:nucleolar protein 4-like [Thrips palmi]